VPKRGRVSKYRLGAGQLAASEQQQRGAMNAIVREAGTYPEIGADIKRLMKDTGKSEKEVSEALRELVRGNALPAGFEKETESMAGLAMLLFGREAARNPTTLATAAMTAELVAGGEMTWASAMAGSTTEFGGGMFPMSMEGAQAAARGLRAEDASGNPADVDGGTVASRAELARREREIIRRWLLMRAKAEGLTGFKTIDELKEFIRKRILEFYGLS
jgi:hypothetical protein